MTIVMIVLFIGFGLISGCKDTTKSETGEEMGQEIIIAGPSFIVSVAFAAHQVALWV